MPRKKAALAESSRLTSAASMRPGHCAPEKAATFGGRTGAPAPRFNEAGALCPGKRPPSGPGSAPPAPASMRPGHCAPEKGPVTLSGRRERVCFNEAGALCPGKRRIPLPYGGRRRSFNEAGALCPGKRVRERAPDAHELGASMRPGHCAPEKGGGSADHGFPPIPASMRPGHCAPEKVVLLRRLLGR